MGNKYEAQRLTRDINLKGLSLTIDFCYTPEIPQRGDEEGADAEIDIEAVWVDEFDVMNMFSLRALGEIEDILWNLIGEG